MLINSEVATSLFHATSILLINATWQEQISAVDFTTHAAWVTSGGIYWETWGDA